MKKARVTGIVSDLAMIRCYIDKNGWRRAEVIDGHPSIGEFLESDIQSSEHHCNELLSKIQNVRNGIEDAFSWTGNANAIEVTSAAVLIENLWDESVGVAKLELGEFEQCLRTWRDFIGASR